MKTQYKLTSEEKTLKLEFRIDRYALIFTNFGGDALAKLSEMLYTGCTQVETTQRVIEYDPEIGAIILIMKQGYVEAQAVDEITEVLHCMNSLCPTTV